MQHKFIFSIVFITLMCFFSCKEDQTIKQIPGLSEIPIDYNIYRFEDILYSLDTSNLLSSMGEVERIHPSFSQIFFTQVLPTQNADSQFGFYDELKKIVAYEPLQKIYDTVQRVFPDDKFFKKDLDDAFRRYKHYFPGETEPNIYTYVSNFRFQSFIFQENNRDGVALGLDLFLAPGFDYRQIDPTNPVFSDYTIPSYTKEQIPKRVIEQLLEDKMGQLSPGNKLIDQMLYFGKKIYLLNQILPSLDMAILNEYTSKQMDWCIDNEKEIWAFLLEKELLYKSDNSTISWYARPAPTSRNMPADSPGRAANFIGYKIVKAYMERFPETSFSDLINLREGTEFLKNSKYKPPRN